MSYRPDIEGMRALAILLVIAAHARVPGLQGGFIGVDIFFVISGYLISGLLIAEHGRTDRIGIAAFYARRFRRLLPALLLMLLATAAAMSFTLPPPDRAYQATAGAAASIWASNLYFAFANIDYFGLASESNAYLHTWSLGVEEQFYLVWPFLILLLLLPGRPFPSRRLVWGMAAVLMVSFLACVWTTQASARHAFYLMPLRAWQFAAGALACMFAWRLARSRILKGGDWLAEASGAGGVVLLVVALLLIDGDTAYPGGWAMLPTLGTVCLLLAASMGTSLTTRVLSLAPMQAIGKLSYSWYLWHWPVLMLGAVLFPAPGLMGRVLLVIAALAIAIVSYHLVERPIRRNDALVQEPRRFILASLLLMLAFVVAFSRWGAAAGVGTSMRTTGNTGAPSKTVAGGVPIIYRMGCDDWYHSDRLVPCVFGPESAPMTAVAVGDSIGLQWFPAYAKVFAPPRWRLIVLTKSSCPMVDSPIFNPRIGREFTECESWRNKALDYIAEVRPDIVIMGTTHAAGFTQDAWVGGTARVLSRIAPFSDEVRIMRSTPILPFNGPTCVWLHRERAEGAPAGEACSAPAADRRNDEVASWLQKAASGWGNVGVIDLNADVCPGGECSAERDGVLVFRDTQHLTAEYSEGLSNRLRAELGGVMEAPND